jgi:hypothetical protein
MAATAETFPANMLHDASVCCSLILRSAVAQKRAVSKEVFWYGHTGSSNPPSCPSPEL